MKPCPCGKSHAPVRVRSGLICPDRLKVRTGHQPLPEPTEAQRAQREDMTPYWRGGER